MCVCVCVCVCGALQARHNEHTVHRQIELFLVGKLVMMQIMSFASKLIYTFKGWSSAVVSLAQVS